MKADALAHLGCLDEATQVLTRLERNATQADEPAAAELARALRAEVLHRQGEHDRAVELAHQVVRRAHDLGQAGSAAEGCARHVLALIDLDGPDPYRTMEQAERAWTCAFGEPDAALRDRIHESIEHMRHLSDVPRPPPPVPVVDIGGLPELSVADRDLLRHYSEGLDHFEVVSYLGTPSDEVRWRVLHIQRQLGAASRAHAIQLQRAAGRLTHYPSGTLY